MRTRPRHLERLQRKYMRNRKVSVAMIELFQDVEAWNNAPTWFDARKLHTALQPGFSKSMILWAPAIKAQLSRAAIERLRELTAKDC